MAGFSVQENRNGTDLALALVGVIDEDVQFPKLDLTDIRTIVFDLKDVKSINSVGIREWLNWVNPLASKCDLAMKNCPKAMVFQFNMVEGFLPKGTKVSSIYVPFFCEKCDLEENVLFTIGQEVKIDSGGAVHFDFDLNKIKPCSEANCELAMDVSEAKYFHFLKRASS